MIIRVVFLVFEYLSPQGSYAASDNHDLGFRTKLIKYLSHELRSLLIVNIVGIELIQQSIERMNVKQRLETLAFLLLYERIEMESLSKDLHTEPILQTLREVLVTHYSAGSAARCGISLEYHQSQFNDPTLRLAVNFELHCP